MPSGVLTCRLPATNSREVQSFVDSTLEEIKMLAFFRGIKPNCLKEEIKNRVELFGRPGVEVDGAMTKFCAYVSNIRESRYF